MYLYHADMPAMFKVAGLVAFDSCLPSHVRRSLFHTPLFKKASLLDSFRTHSRCEGARCAPSCLIVSLHYLYIWTYFSHSCISVNITNQTISKLFLLQADQETGDTLLLLRNQVNLVLEQARNKKLLGSALEAKVLLHVADQSKGDSLKSLNAAANGADPLRYAFITSQAQLVDSQVLCCAVAVLCWAVLGWAGVLQPEVLCQHVLCDAVLCYAGLC